jgi:hypothetical protein
VQVRAGELGPVGRLCEYNFDAQLRRSSARRLFLSARRLLPCWQNRLVTLSLSRLRVQLLRHRFHSLSFFLRIPLSVGSTTKGRNAGQPPHAEQRSA